MLLFSQSPRVGWVPCCRSSAGHRAMKFAEYAAFYVQFVPLTGCVYCTQRVLCPGKSLGDCRCWRTAAKPLTYSYWTWYHSHKNTILLQGYAMDFFKLKNSTSLADHPASIEENCITHSSSLQRLIAVVTALTVQAWAVRCAIFIKTL